MKSKLSPFIFLACTVILFGSCGSLTNFSIEKRQHRGGYYVDWGNGKVKTDPAKKTETASRTDRNSATTAPVPITKEPKAETPVSNPVVQPAPAAPSAISKKETPIRNTFRVSEEPLAWTMDEVKEAIDYSYSASESGYDRRSSDTPDWVLAVLCILLPPLAVFLKMGAVTTEFWISILLTLLFWIPGVIYAFIICF